MLLSDIDAYLRKTLSIDDYGSIDASLNGLQVEREKREVRKIAFAVDACMETIRRAAEEKADLLFVHHGFFWGQSIALRGSHYRRIKTLLEHDIALYAVHLPLDLHPTLGNNACMAEKLGLHDIEPFGEHQGLKIGWKGIVSEPCSLDTIIETLELDRNRCLAVLPFGPDNIKRIGIVSGKATREIDQVVEEGLDLYITGESTHTIYHYCMEEEINLLAAGHYQTETFGVYAVSELIENETDVETVFIDIPTGL